ncbi:hypothetical protein Sango_1748200 [Sesamum angolense]|uniref:Retrotransposon Copia-like N-terminal domain-containing protein n=1 Tax=Sesamum angolense TaxID=2727404 RepID=A0AAE1WMJ1_9LAMI|nr:hypothetical protein Sango_1748200 [Sesamum angolense]
MEILRVQPTDNPGMTLVSNPLNGTNFLDWSRSMRIALGAKMKLGYINGKIPKPSEDSEEFERWNRADCMVTLWLLNSISKDIIESFLYVDSTRELWQELETRFWSVTKAYAMVLCMEKQREVSSRIAGAAQNMRCRAFCAEEFEISQEESVQNVLDNNNVSETVRMELIRLIREMNPQNSIEPDLEEFDDYAAKRTNHNLYVHLADG